MTLNHSLSLFIRWPVAGGLMAGGAAPLCYLSGERLGAVTVPDPWQLAWIALAWAVIFIVTFSRLKAQAARDCTPATDTPS